MLFLLLVRSFEQIAELLLFTANTEKQLLNFTVHMLRNLTTSSTGRAMKLVIYQRFWWVENAVFRFFSELNLKSRAFPLLFVFLLEESLKLIAVADLQELRLKQ